MNANQWYGLACYGCGHPFELVRLAGVGCLMAQAKLEALQESRKFKDEECCRLREELKDATFQVASAYAKTFSYLFCIWNHASNFIF